MNSRRLFIFMAAPRPVGLFQDFFAYANRLRRYFDPFIFGDPFDALLEAHFTMGRDNDVFVASGSADVRELLFTADVDVEVHIARILADDHAFVNPGARWNEDDAAL